MNLSNHLKCLATGYHGFSDTRPDRLLRRGFYKFCVTETYAVLCLASLKTRAPTGQTLTHSPHWVHLDSARGLSW